MKNSDKKLVKRSAMVLADQIAMNTPGLSIAWGFTKALLGRGMELRQEKALEWVELIRDHPRIFVKEVLSNPAFQDGFVYATEKYIRERNSQKRKFAKNILLDFGACKDFEKFELERLLITLEQITTDDLLTLRDVDNNRVDRNYQVYGSTDKNVDSLFHLIALGILRQDIASRYISESGYAAPFVNISEFGKNFISYLQYGSS